MARKPRLDVQGGLYHLITRGNNRRTIFEAPEDYQKFLQLLEIQKGKLPFLLYAYCLMNNHVHLLVERQGHAISRVMHRLLTGYSQYYNRKYGRSGHLLQGRHKALLCQSDRYLSELVRYIHLNPVRAKIVRKPEQYEHSSHRSYLALQADGIVDVDPVLRHFGAKKKMARAHFDRFVKAGMKMGHREEFYQAEQGRILGTEEFVDATIHRIGDTSRARKNRARRVTGDSHKLSADDVVAVVERICEVTRVAFCCPGRNARTVHAKEALIMIGAEAGVSLAALSELMGTHSSTVSRRLEAARVHAIENRELGKVLSRIRKII